MNTLYKKKKKIRTRKIYKGGQGDLPIIDKNISQTIKKMGDAAALVASLLESSQPLINCFLKGFMCPLSFVWNEFKFSIEMLNDILLLSGLYVKNLFYLGFESNLNNILPEYICFDLFDENTCNTKIIKLLNMKSLKEENKLLPKELIYRGGQRGGSFSQTCKNEQTPGVVCPDNRSNENELKPEPEPFINPIVKVLKNNVSFTTLDAFPDKETANVFLLNIFKVCSIYDLYNILKIIRVLYFIDDGKPIPEPEPSQKNKLNKDDVLRLEHNFKMSKGFKEWKKCNDFHLERNMDDQTRQEIVELCNVKCDDCTMKKQSLLHTSKDNYNPSFGNSYETLQDILEIYYKGDKSKTYDHSNIYDALKDEDQRIKFLNSLTEEQIFDFFNIGTPTNKEPMEEEVLVELKKYAKMNRELFIHNIVSKLLLYKLFNDSSKKDKTNFQQLNFNSRGESISKLIFR